jgi:hypothetical protein
MWRSLRFTQPQLYLIAGSFIYLAFLVDELNFSNGQLQNFPKVKAI